MSLELLLQITILSMNISSPQDYTPRTLAYNFTLDCDIYPGNGTAIPKERKTPREEYAPENNSTPYSPDEPEIEYEIEDDEEVLV